MILNVVATGSKGQPIPDLTASDFRVVDDGVKEQVTNLVKRADKEPVQIILLDLLNLSFVDRAVTAQKLRTSLNRLPNTDALFLYLLLPNGSIYAIRALQPDSKSEVSCSLASALDVIGKNSTQLRVGGLDTDSGQRFWATYNALIQVEQMIASDPGSGRKQLVWISSGDASNLLVRRWWYDMAPALRELAAHFNQDDISIYTVDPGLHPGTVRGGGLDILAAATGGRSTATSEFSEVIRRAQSDAAASYRLSYRVPSISQRSGKYRTIRLICDRKGVQVTWQQAWLSTAKP